MGSRATAWAWSGGPIVPCAAPRPTLSCKGTAAEANIPAGIVQPRRGPRGATVPASHGHVPVVTAFQPERRPSQFVDPYSFPMAVLQTTRGLGRLLGWLQGGVQGGC